MDDAFQPFDERFARVLHTGVDGCEAAAPRRPRRDGAAAQGAPFGDEQQHGRGDQHGCDERDLREARPQRQFGRRLPAGAETGQQRRGYLRQQRQYRPRQQPDEEDACGGQRHGGDAVVVRFVHFGHLVRAGRTEEDDAVEFGEGEQSQSADQGERRDAGCRQQHLLPFGDAAEHAGVDNKFRDEPVQRRQCADRRLAGQEEDRRDGHLARHAAEAVECGGMRFGVEVACAEEEQRFEERVVEGVQQRAGHAAQGHRVVACAASEQGYADGDEDDPDVFDRGVGQQPLDVVLHGGQ